MASTAEPGAGVCCFFHYSALGPTTTDYRVPARLRGGPAGRKKVSRRTARHGGLMSAQQKESHERKNNNQAPLQNVRANTRARVPVKNNNPSDTQERSKNIE